MQPDHQYMSGFGNEFATEALAGALPQGMNNPQKAPLGLYAEQLNGSAFTAFGRDNQRSWLYRILPSVVHQPFKQADLGLWRSAPFTEVPPPPDQLRWDPFPWPTQPTDFISGVTTIAGNGDVATRQGSAVHLYAINAAMQDSCFYNADGDFLFVPQDGALELQTEMGWITASPGEIAVIQRGIKFRVGMASKRARGYICENYGEPFTLPYKGPIGANGLANTRDFLTPQAAYEDRTQPFVLTAKFQGQLWTANLARSPFDVVGWHGNYAPYKYDLKLFNTMNTVSFDHPDPSIFTVLTSPTNRPGAANVDFVIFPPRWMVAEKTFRPPYFHRNVMSEYMGLIKGVYDAKPAGGFEPGGSSLHNCMTPHGPETDAFIAATHADLKPHFMGDTLAFMFESSLVYRPSKAALTSPTLQKDYLKCWRDLKPYFKKP